MKFEVSKNGSRNVGWHQPALPPEIIDVSKPFDFRKLYHLALEKWLLILLVGLVVSGITAYVVYQMPVKYQAKAVLQVEQEEWRLIGADSFVGEDLRSPEALNTIVQNVKNSSVLRRVIATNELAISDRFLPQKAGQVSETQLLRALAGMITVKLRPDTRLIDIIVVHPDRELAVQLANSVAEEFIRQNLYDRFNTTKAANSLLYEEALRLKGKLEQSEKEIQAYREANQTISLEEREMIILEKLRDLTARYTEAQANRLAIQAELAEVNAAGDNPAAILALPRVQEDVAVAELRRRLVDQEANVAAMAVQYQPEFPKLVQAREQLVELEKVAHRVAEKVRAAVQASYNAALARERNLEEALRQGQAEAMEMDKKSVGYNVLMRELQSDRALYDSVLMRLKETDLSKGLGQASLAMVEPASMPPSLIKPPRMLLVGGAFFIGLFGTLMALFAGKAIHGSIHTVDEAENLLKLPVWAAIPAAGSSGDKKLPHIAAEAPESFCSESFRTLRTTASIVAPKKEKRVMLFTSADPAEGKTFCSLNYAICQAQEGRRTLLIDLDLRKPSVGASLELDSKTPGVTDYILKNKPLNDLVRPTAYPNLFVLCAGSRVANPAEQLAKACLSNLIGEATAQFDRVVIDTAPINAVSDTLLILPFVDQVCLVVKSGKTPHRAVKRAVDVMTRANVEPSGIVLNYLPQTSGRGYYYYYAPHYEYGPRNGSKPKALLRS